MANWVDHGPENAQERSLVFAEAVALDHQSNQIAMIPNANQTWAGYSAGGKSAGVYVVVEQQFLLLSYCGQVVLS